MRQRYCMITQAVPGGASWHCRCHRAFYDSLTLPSVRPVSTSHASEPSTSIRGNLLCSKSCVCIFCFPNRGLNDWKANEKTTLSWGKFSWFLESKYFDNSSKCESLTQDSGDCQKWWRVSQLQLQSSQAMEWVNFKNWKVTGYATFFLTNDDSFQNGLLKITCFKPHETN